MMIRKFLLAAAFATAAAISAAAEPAPPPPANPDQDCDDMMEELVDLKDEVTKSKANARTPLATCAVNGQLLGIAKSGRVAAMECYSAGKKLDDVVAALDKVVKDLEASIGATCR
jgi:hypothetical protein